MISHVCTFNKNLNILGKLKIIEFRPWIKENKAFRIKILKKKQYSRGKSTPPLKKKSRATFSRFPRKIYDATN